MTDTQIQPLESPQQFQACEDIQLQVWGKLAVSAELLKVTQEHGGVVLGALAGEQVCGFIYAFLARYHRRLVHWSHMMAVRPDKRDRGLGYEMKRMHRHLALTQRIRSICWTFDPLQSRNASLNISKLGADIDEYIPDCYGEFGSLIEKGLPSDRFLVNWRISKAPVKKRLQSRTAPHPVPAVPYINETSTNQDGFPENRRISDKLTEPILLVEIPACTDRMRQHAVDLAYRWRMETRSIFQQYLRRGYRIADFVRDQSTDGGRCFYVLHRRSSTMNASCE
jgi:predicted GNAT superfamily acetyltransferase